MRIEEIKGKLEKRKKDFWDIEESWRKKEEEKKPEKREKGGQILAKTNIF